MENMDSITPPMSVDRVSGSPASQYDSALEKLAEHHSHLPQSLVSEDTQEEAEFCSFSDTEEADHIADQLDKKELEQERFSKNQEIANSEHLAPDNVDDDKELNESEPFDTLVDKKLEETNAASVADVDEDTVDQCAAVNEVTQPTVSSESLNDSAEFPRPPIETEAIENSSSLELCPPHVKFTLDSDSYENTQKKIVDEEYQEPQQGLHIPVSLVYDQIPVIPCAGSYAHEPIYLQSTCNDTAAPEIEVYIPPPSLTCPSVDHNPPQRTYSYINADVESDLERAVQIDPTVEQELIYNVINDEETANNLISDAIIADSIVALTTIEETEAAISANAAAGIVTTVRDDFEEGDLRNTAIFESSLEAHAEIAEDNQEDNSEVTQEIEVDEELFTLTERKWHSSTFLYVSEAEDDDDDPKPPKQVEITITTEDDMDNQSEQGEPTPNMNGNAKLGEQSDDMVTGEKKDTEAAKCEDEVLEVEEIKEELKEEVNGITADTDKSPEALDLNPVIVVKEVENNRHDAADDVKMDDGRRLPDGESDKEGTDLESTQDMTDTDIKTDMNGRHLTVSDEERQKSEKDDAALQDIRTAVISREAILAVEKSTIKKSPSGAVLQYQERKTKYGKREANGTIPNGTHLIESDSSNMQIRPLIGFKAGRAVLIEGVVNKAAKGFSISLQTTEPPEKQDVAMLFSPNFSEKNILCNTYFHDTWGPPQIYDKKFPFSKNKNFVIKISTDSHCFKISVNGHRIMDYDHRMPLDKVKYLRLEGDAVFNNVECPFVLDLPYVLDVEHGFRNDSGIKLDAFVWPTASLFELNLLCGEKARQTHASFMMKVFFLDGKQVKVEMMSFCNDKLGDQHVVEGDLNIQRGEDFKMRIILFEQTFSIEVNDTELAVYEHGLPIDKLGHVLIDGDISLYSVRFLRSSRRMSSGLMLSTAYQEDRCCQCSIT